MFLNSTKGGRLKRINVVLICHLSPNALDPFADQGLVGEGWLVTDADDLPPVTF